MKTSGIRIATPILCAALLSVAVRAAARQGGGMGAAVGIHLYTKPDPDAHGGIMGTVAAPAKPLAAVFAIPPDEPRFVYKGTITGPDRRGFRFQGLPVSRYDLMIFFDNVFYEGLTLTRAEDTLTKADRQAIETITMRSETFFNKKTIHRLEGLTGNMTGTARALSVFRRTGFTVDYTWTGGRNPGDPGVHSDHRRAVKLIVLEDVGPGWQVKRTREIFTIEVPPSTPPLRSVYRRKLSRIRVTDHLKDLGEINLSAN